MSAVIRGATRAALGTVIAARLARAVRRGDPGKTEKICVEAGLSKEEQRDLIQKAKEEKLRKELRAEVRRRGGKIKKTPLTEAEKDDPKALRRRIGEISISKKGEFALDKFTVINHPDFDEDDPRVSHQSFTGAQLQANATRRVLAKRAQRIQERRDKEAEEEGEKKSRIGRMRGASQRDNRGGSASGGGRRRGSFSLKGSGIRSSKPVRFE